MKKLDRYLSVFFLVLSLLFGMKAQADWQDDYYAYVNQIMRQLLWEDGAIKWLDWELITEVPNPLDASRGGKLVTFLGLNEDPRFYQGGMEEHITSVLDGKDAVEKSYPYFWMYHAVMYQIKRGQQHPQGHRYLAAEVQRRLLQKMPNLTDIISKRALQPIDYSLEPFIHRERGALIASLNWRIPEEQVLARVCRNSLKDLRAAPLDRYTAHFSAVSMLYGDLMKKFKSEGNPLTLLDMLDKGGPGAHFLLLRAMNTARDVHHLKKMLVNLREESSDLATRLSEHFAVGLPPRKKNQEPVSLFPGMETLSLTDADDVQPDDEQSDDEQSDDEQSDDEQSDDALTAEVRAFRDACQVFLNACHRQKHYLRGFFDAIGFTPEGTPSVPTQMARHKPKPEKKRTTNEEQMLMAKHREDNHKQVKLMQQALTEVQDLVATMGGENTFALRDLQKQHRDEVHERQRLEDEHQKLIRAHQRLKVDYSCPICMQPVVEAVKTPCSHVFCKHCILQNLSDRRNCPSCGVVIKQGVISRVYFGPTDRPANDPGVMKR